jgi:hypothetical protein
MAIDTDGNDTVERAGVLDAEGRPSAVFPWTNLNAPPALLRSPAGIVAARLADSARGLQRVELWSPPGQQKHLVEGDHLEVVDAACSGSTCAVLTNFAAQAAGPGATLMVGNPTGASAWKRIDFPGGENDWVPFSIASMENATIVVALVGDDKVGLWRVAEGPPTHTATIEAPLGAYDVVLGEGPIVIAPGESIDGECSKDGFTLKLISPTGKTFEVDGQVPPETVVVRRLDGGFIVGWLSPTRCHGRSQQTARAFLLGRDGAPKTSTMAIADADGFAFSTKGSDLDLWLARRGELVWAKGTCRIPEPGGR